MKLGHGTTGTPQQVLGPLVSWGLLKYKGDGEGKGDGGRRKRWRERAALETALKWESEGSS